MADADLLDDLSEVGSCFYRVSTQLYEHNGIAIPGEPPEKVPVVLSNWSLIFVSGWKFNHTLKRRG
jgi:hypothetical protein